MKEIPTTRGFLAKVDDEDYERVMQFKWAANVNGNTVYATRCIRKPNGDRTKQSLHRFVLNLPAGKKPQVDHEDRNGLNCQKHNLRMATHAQNQGNQKKRKGTSSKYRGVTWHKKDLRWQASIEIKGKCKYLGQFAKEKEAARAYDAAAKEVYGEFANLNFEVNP
jgi:hypothetical protein